MTSLKDKLSAEELESFLQEISAHGEWRRAEKLRAHISATQREADRLRKALEPFAEIAQYVDDETMSDSDTIVIDVEEPTGCAIAKLPWSDFRRARRAALNQEQTEEGGA